MRDPEETWPPNTPVPLNFTRESFYGFEMDDDEVGPGAYRTLAIELKHIFESTAADADEKNEEMFLSKDFDYALRRFTADPVRSTLDYLLEVSPTLIPHVSELTELFRVVKGHDFNEC